MALGLTQPVTEMSTRNISYRVKPTGAENHNNFMCRLSWYLGASTSWIPQGLSWPVQAVLYLLRLLFYERVELCCLFPIRLRGVLFN
jgi:hypothetical protein